MKRNFGRTAAVAAGAAALLGATALPAQAFSSGSSITLSGVTYRASAYSCNLYLTSCDWSARSSTSSSRSFTHRGDVKANGINVSITISADPSASISGNSTTLATATETGFGTSNYMAGVARPSIFSVSVAARSRLSTSAASVSSGWTTW